MYGEAPSVFSCEIRTARKEHRCCECHRTINIGDRYQMVKGIWDGKAGRFKTCHPCADLRDEINEECRYEDERPCFEELGEYAREMGKDWPPC